MDNQEWKTIDSAPKDDDLILLWSPTCGRVTARRVQENKNWWCLCIDFGGGGRGLFVMTNSHRDSYGRSTYIDANYIDDPTHWMPLPKRPRLLPEPPAP